MIAVISPNLRCSQVFRFIYHILGTGTWEQRKLKWFLRVSKLKNIDGIFDKNSVLSVSGEFGVVNQIAFQGRSFAGKSILNYGILDHGRL